MKLPSLRLLVLLIVACALPALLQAQNDRLRLSQGVALIDSFIQIEQYSKALVPSAQLLSAADSLLETNDTLALKIRFLHARVLQFNGRYDDAIRLHEQCLAYFRTTDSLLVARSYDNIGIGWYGKKKPDKAIAYHEAALALFLQYGDRWSPALANCHNNLANALADARRNEEALHHYDLAIAIYTNNKGKDSADEGKILQNSAGCFLAEGDLYGAIGRYKEAVRVLEKYKTERPLYLANAYYNLGLCCNALGDLDLAEGYLVKALELRRASLPADHNEVLISVRSMGLLCNKKGDFERAGLYFETVLAARRRNLKTWHPYLFNSMLDVANSARQQQNWELAETLLLEAIQRESAAEKPDSIRLAKAYNNYGNLLYEMQRADSALVVNFNTLRIRQSILPGDDPDLAYSWSNISNCYLLKNDLVRADSFATLALQLWLGGQVDASTLPYSYRQVANCRMKLHRWAEADSLLAQSLLWLRVENPHDYPQARSPLELTNTLIARAWLHLEWGKATKRKEELEAALFWANSALDYLPFWEKTLAPGSSRNDTRQLSREAHGICIEADYWLITQFGQKERKAEAFSHIEQTHNTQLHDAFLDSEARAFAKVDKNLLLREHQLLVDIAYSESRIFKMKSSGTADTDSLFSAELERLLGLQQDLTVLKNQIETTNPKYVQYRYDQPAAISLTDLQQRVLRPGQTLLEYFVGDSCIFVFKADRKTSELLRIAPDFSLNAAVHLLQSGITGYYGVPEHLRYTALIDSTLANFENASMLLYQKLLAPIAAGLENDLLIIPDGELYYVPFEVLMTGAPEFPGAYASYPMLIWKKNIGYDFSCTLHEELSRAQKHAFQYQLLAVAPFSEKGPSGSLPFPLNTPQRDNRDSLPYSLAEIQAVWKTRNGGKMLLNNEATLQQFSLLAPGSRVIHLATHACANRLNGNFCYIVFAETNDSLPRLLYVRDIYNLNLFAEMVTLSACETGIGEWHPGEGMIGLARAFTWAGARSIVASLWSVNDPSTARLMELFYGNLRSMPKDVALSAAKRSYLTDARHGNEANHPYFWSAFTVAGNQSPLK